MDLKSRVVERFLIPFTFYTLNNTNLENKIIIKKGKQYFIF
jgi:hypothetical protein